MYWALRHGSPAPNNRAGGLRIRFSSGRKPTNPEARAAVIQPGRRSWSGLERTRPNLDGASTIMRRRHGSTHEAGDGSPSIRPTPLPGAYPAPDARRRYRDAMRPQILNGHPDGVGRALGLPDTDASAEPMPAYRKSDGAILGLVPRPYLLIRGNMRHPRICVIRAAGGRCAGDGHGPQPSGCEASGSPRPAGSYRPPIARGNRWRNGPSASCLNPRAWRGSSRRSATAAQGADVKCAPLSSPRGRER